MILGAALLGAGQLLGTVVRRVKPASRSLTQSQPTCDCGHKLAFHSRDGDQVCSAEVARDVYDRDGDWAGYDYVACACRRYVGPIPLEDWARVLPPTPDV